MPPRGLALSDRHTHRHIELIRAVCVVALGHEQLRAAADRGRRDGLGDDEWTFLFGADWLWPQSRRHAAALLVADCARGGAQPCFRDVVGHRAQNGHLWIAPVFIAAGRAAGFLGRTYFDTRRSQRTAG